MTPRSFDLATCKEILGDARVRVVEAQARKDVEEPTYCVPTDIDGNSFWAIIRQKMTEELYLATWRARLARLERTKPIIKE